MTYTLPLMDSQLRFALTAERTGRRLSVPLVFRAPPSTLRTAVVDDVVQSIASGNPALSCRVGFSRGITRQEWQPSGCDFAELAAPDSETAAEQTAAAVDDFETSLDEPAMAARLIRTPDADDLLLILDHTFVDEQSLLLVKSQLATPPRPDGTPWSRYEAAVEDRLAFEAAAARGPGPAFWSERLGTIAGALPAARLTSRSGSIIVFPAVEVPHGFSGSLFPYVLLALHGALRDVSGSPAVIGYPWGLRNPAFPDVVGCFMNTVISVGAAGSPDTADDFLDRWFREIDHADVPYSSVAALEPAFSGSVSAFITLEHVGDRTVGIAGVPAVEIPSSHGYPAPGAPTEAVVVAAGNEVQLRLIVDETAVDYHAADLGDRWCRRLGEALAGFPGSSSPDRAT